MYFNTYKLMKVMNFNIIFFQYIIKSICCIHQIASGITYISVHFHFFGNIILNKLQHKMDKKLGRWGSKYIRENYM